MLDILSRVPHLEHAREEGGLEFIQSVQVLSSIGHVCLHSYGNMFHLQVHFHVNHQTNFPMKSFPQRLVLEQRHKVTRK